MREVLLFTAFAICMVIGYVFMRRLGTGFKKEKEKNFISENSWTCYNESQKDRKK